jgi:ectoine hydrolase
MSPDMTSRTPSSTTDRVEVSSATEPVSRGRDLPPPGERARRVAQVRERLSERGWDALVVSDPANMYYYLSGYDAWSFYTPQCIVVPVDGPPHLFARAMDAGGAHHTCDFDADRIHGYPEHLVHKPEVHPYDWIAERARELGLLPAVAGTNVAVEGDAHFFSPRGYLALAAGLGDTRLVDSQELVNWVRLVKSEHEVGLLRQAGAVSSRAMRVALEAVAIGRRQSEAVAEIMQAQVLGFDGVAGDYPAIVPMLPTGETAGTPHLTWSGDRFVAGEATTIELAGVHHRYHCPLARTISLGTPPNRLRHAADTVAEGMEAALATLVPGGTGGDVHAAFTTVLHREGLEKESRIGYSIGIGYPPDWGERTVSLRAEDETVLEAGMAFHVIIGMWMDGWGYELSEPVLVGPDGAERLTDLPQQLTIRE